MTKTRIKLYFKWYDFWVGWYYDTENKALYLGYFPMLGVKIWWVPLVEKICMDFHCSAPRWKGVVPDDEHTCPNCGLTSLMYNSKVG